MTQAPATPELVERLRDPDFKGSFQHLRPWTEIDALFEEAADALEAQQARIAELEAALAERERLILDAHDALEEASDNLRGSYRQPACEAYDRARRAIYAIRSRQALSSQGRREGGEEPSDDPCGRCADSGLIAMGNGQYENCPCGTFSNLTPEEQRAQAGRCSCKGCDDYCPCQNVPDAITRAARATDNTNPKAGAPEHG